MTPKELLRELRRVARRRGWQIQISQGAKHTKVRLGTRSAVIGRHSNDLKIGTLSAILEQLEITPEDLKR
jgi:predicted RNA binding protein YcfA (HicA-like mRNA interferase family)